jgi:hypothetical protein
MKKGYSRTEILLILSSCFGINFVFTKQYNIPCDRTPLLRTTPFFYYTTSVWLRVSGIVLRMYIIIHIDIEDKGLSKSSLVAGSTS